MKIIYKEPYWVKFEWEMSEHHDNQYVTLFDKKENEISKQKTKSKRCPNGTRKNTITGVSKARPKTINNEITKLKYLSMSVSIVICGALNCVTK